MHRCKLLSFKYNVKNIINKGGANTIFQNALIFSWRIIQRHAPRRKAANESGLDDTIAAQSQSRFG